MKRKRILWIALLGLQAMLGALTACSDGDNDRSLTPPITVTFGGPGRDSAQSVQQTADGGFVLAGFTTSFGAGSYDAYLVRMDAENNTLWEKTFGGISPDYAYSVQQTADGGFVLAGESASFGAGSSDGYLIRTDAQGNALWEKTFGGAFADTVKSVQQTADGGFVLAGYTDAAGAGNYASLIRTDAQGNTLWEKTFGGALSAWSVQQTADGGFVLAGEAASVGAGISDAYLIRTDEQGNTLWEKTFGGTNPDSAYCVQQAADGGFVLAGYTSSFGAGNSDAYLIRTDTQGNALWEKTFGGPDPGRDSALSVQQTADGGFVLAGFTTSFGAGSYDAYLVRTDAQGNTLWEKTFGDKRFDIAYSVLQTADGGFVLTGEMNGNTSSMGLGFGADAFLIRTNTEGN